MTKFGTIENKCVVNGKDIVKIKGVYRVLGAHKNRHVNFKSRRDNNVRSLKHVNRHFMTSSYFQFDVEQTQGSVNVYFKRALKKPENVTSLPIKHYSSMMWWLQVLFPKHSTHDVDDGQLLLLMREIGKKGIIETVFSKWTYTIGEEPCLQTRILPVIKDDVKHACYCKGEAISTAASEALDLWAMYEGGDFPPFSGDTAIPEGAELSKRSGIFPFNKHKGLQFLLEKKFFTEVQIREDNKVLTYYQTPEVTTFQSTIVRCLQTLNKRARRAVSSAIPGHLNAKQREAYREICSNPLTILTGYTGTGKTEVTCSALKVCGPTAVVAPSFTAANVARQRCAGKGVTNVACEVVQFAQFGFAHGRGWRMTKFMLKLSGMSDIDIRKCEMYYDRCKKEQRSPQWTKFVKDELSHPYDWASIIDFNKIRTLVFEEFGMVDIENCSRTLAAAVSTFKNLERVVFSGDPYQLKSVGRGNVLKDFINSNMFAHIHLTDIVRANPDTALSQNQVKVLDNDYNGLDFDDTFVKVECPETLQFPWFRFQSGNNEYLQDGMSKGAEYTLPLTQVVDEYMKDTAAGEEPHILVYTNKEAEQFNREIVEKRFPSPSPFKGKLIVGMKVIAVKNYNSGQTVDDSLDDDAEDHNVETDQVQIVKGNLFVINSLDSFTELNCDDEEEEYQVVDLRTWGDDIERQVRITIKSVDLNKVLKVGYASTGHKMQGAERKNIYIVLFDNCCFYDNEALYTNTGRAMVRCKIFTRDEDMKNVVSRTNRSRWSTLSAVLREM